MKRLLEEATSPLEEQAASLLREVGPLEPSDIARARVRRAIERRPTRVRANGLRRLALALCLVAGASAAAVWGGDRLLPMFGSSPEEVGAPQASESSGPARGHRAATEVTEAAPLAVPQGPAQKDPAVEVPAVESPVQSPTGAQQGFRPEAKRPTEPTSAASRGAVSQSASDAVLVQQALEALRNDGDAARATQLLEKYRKKGQNQALSEEALALSIEAAQVNDPARAKRLAQEYLRAYPSGRFKQLATRAAGR